MNGVVKNVRKLTIFVNRRKNCSKNKLIIWQHFNVQNVKLLLTQFQCLPVAVVVLATMEECIFGTF